MTADLSMAAPQPGQLDLDVEGAAGLADSVDLIGARGLAGCVEIVEEVAEIGQGLSNGRHRTQGATGAGTGTRIDSPHLTHLAFLPASSSFRRYFC